MVNSRDTLVMVPQAVVGRWEHAPWSALVAAAEAGEDGLSWTTGIRKISVLTVPRVEAGYACFREGDDAWGTDRACLFVQNF